MHAAFALNPVHLAIHGSCESREAELPRQSGVRIRRIERHTPLEFQYDAGGESVDEPPPTQPHRLDVDDLSGARIRHRHSGNFKTLQHREHLKGYVTRRCRPTSLGGQLAHLAHQTGNIKTLQRKATEFERYAWAATCLAGGIDLFDAELLQLTLFEAGHADRAEAHVKGGCTRRQALRCNDAHVAHFKIAHLDALVEGAHGAHEGIRLRRRWIRPHRSCGRHHVLHLGIREFGGINAEGIARHCAHRKFATVRELERVATDAGLALDRVVAILGLSCVQPNAEHRQNIQISKCCAVDGAAHNLRAVAGLGANGDLVEAGQPDPTLAQIFNFDVSVGVVDVNGLAACFWHPRRRRDRHSQSNDQCWDGNRGCIRRGIECHCALESILAIGRTWPSPRTAKFGGDDLWRLDAGLLILAVAEPALSIQPRQLDTLGCKFLGPKVNAVEGDFANFDVNGLITRCLDHHVIDQQIAPPEIEIHRAISGCCAHGAQRGKTGLNFGEGAALEILVGTERANNSNTGNGATGHNHLLHQGSSARFKRSAPKLVQRRTTAKSKPQGQLPL